MRQLRFLNLLIIPFLLFACGAEPKGDSIPKAIPNSLPPISSDQQAALDALNVLQQNLDVPNKIYSTFPNITQPFYPHDSTFVISQSDFHLALDMLVEKYGTRLDASYRDSLTHTSALALEEYTVRHCRDTASNKYVDFKYSTTGAWVLPNVLERRDVVIVW